MPWMSMDAKWHVEHVRGERGTVEGGGAKTEALQGMLWAPWGAVLPSTSTN